MAAVPPGDGVVLGGEGGELGLSLRQRALRRLTLGDEFSRLLRSDGGCELRLKALHLELGGVEVLLGGGEVPRRA